MADSRLITVAIHTFNRATMVKNLLETEGVEVSLQNVNLTEPSVSSGVRIRIHEDDLPLALRIIENAEIFTSPSAHDLDSTPPILVPTDFSDYSERAAHIAFDIAHRLGASITFLHSYIDPSQSGHLQLSDALTYDPLDTEERIRLEEDQKRLTALFTNKFRQGIKQGSVPPVKFTSEVVEGVPEDTILEYAKLNNPPLIVMGTRAAVKKEKDLIGSVTAEVLDSCRVPAFTIPEMMSLDDIRRIHNIMLFSSLEQSDILALDAFYRLFPGSDFICTIVCVPGRRQSNANTVQEVKAMLEYCGSHYPNYTFELRMFTNENAFDGFTKLIDEGRAEMMIVPNRKKNIFARLFNPGLAHKLVFHADIPMMVVPV